MLVVTVREAAAATGAAMWRQEGGGLLPTLGQAWGGGKPSAIAPTQEAARLAKLSDKMLLVGVKCLEASPVSDILV